MLATVTTEDQPVKRGRRMPTNMDGERVAAEMRLKIAAHLQVAPDRIRYVNSQEPGQFNEVGWRWEIQFNGQWRELPWHFDGPLRVTQDLVRNWYG